MNPESYKNRFEGYAVKCQNVQEFIKNHLKLDAYLRKSVETAQAIQRYYLKYYEMYGFVFLSSYDSKSGQLVSFY